MTVAAAEAMERVGLVGGTNADTSAGDAWSDGVAAAAKRALTEALLAAALLASVLCALPAMMRMADAATTASAAHGTFEEVWCEE